MQNGTISLKVTPYVGTYDGQEHDALSNISVEPSDAKLEYSINGGKYSEEMPKIKDTSEFTVTVVASKEGYKTVSTTETIKVNRAEGKLTLSSYSGTLTYPNSTSFTINENTTNVSITSSNTNIATASLNGNTVTVKSIGAGSATITVKSASNTNYNEKTAAYAVNVKIPTFTESSGVGYYADVDGNGTVDGIIFADFKNGGSGSWGGAYYTISTVTGLKEYYVSKTNYNGPFGIKDVLSARGSGNARFNVMALSDYNNGATYRFTDAKAITSGEWSTPSRNEWAAFGRELGITNSNYSGYGLKGYYWSASANSSITDCGYCAHVSAGQIDISHYTYDYPVRLSRTF